MQYQDIEKYYRIERADRLPQFIVDSLESDLKPAYFWYALTHLWSDGENLYDYKEYVEEMMLEHFETQAVLDAHDKKEQKKLKELWAEPEVTVYRGQNEADPEMNLSWTLDKNLAMWFATRFNFPKEKLKEWGREELYRGEPVLITGKIYGGTVYCYLNESHRNEQECLIPRPEEFIYEVTTEKIERENHV